MNNQSLPSPISIKEFLLEIGLDTNHIENIVKWWEKFRNNIQIHYFTFNTHLPIFGGVCSEHSVAINKKLYSEPLLKLFILLHESKHTDQICNNTIKPYFDNAKEDNIDDFMFHYVNLEKEANDYAFSTMKELGYEDFVEKNEYFFRSNENNGNQVFHSMKSEIQKSNADNIQKLVISMIL